MRNELSASMSSKGQVVIPSDVRERLGLVQGSVLRVVIDGEDAWLLPPAGDVRRLKRSAGQARITGVDRGYKSSHCRAAQCASGDV
jgi:AbrB family looped-hinge helix DNA binding protein